MFHLTQLTNPPQKKLYGKFSVCQIHDFRSCVHFWTKVVNSLFRSQKSNQKALDLNNLSRCAPWHFRAIPASLSCCVFLSTYHLMRQIYRQTLPSPCTAFSQSLSVNLLRVTYPKRTGGKQISLGPRDPKRFGRAEQ